MLDYPVPLDPQHNPHVGNGKQAFIDYRNRMAEQYPGERVECKRVLADGDGRGRNVAALRHSLGTPVV